MFLQIWSLIFQGWFKYSESASDFLLPIFSNKLNYIVKSFQIRQTALQAVSLGICFIVKFNSGLITSNFVLLSVIDQFPLWQQSTNENNNNGDNFDNFPTKAATISLEKITILMKITISLGFIPVGRWKLRRSTNGNNQNLSTLQSSRWSLRWTSSPSPSLSWSWWQ